MHRMYNMWQNQQTLQRPINGPVRESGPIACFLLLFQHSIPSSICGPLNIWIGQGIGSHAQQQWLRPNESVSMLLRRPQARAGALLYALQVSRIRRRLHRQLQHPLADAQLQLARAVNRLCGHLPRPSLERPLLPRQRSTGDGDIHAVCCSPAPARPGAPARLLDTRSSCTACASGPPHEE